MGKKMSERKSSRKSARKSARNSIKNLANKSSKRKISKSLKKKSEKKSMRKSGKKRLNLSSIRGGGILPSSISNIGYSIIGSGESFLDGLNGKRIPYSQIASPEEQKLLNNGYYTSNHGVI
jgi:hypothetical protein